SVLYRMPALMSCNSCSCGISSIVNFWAQIDRSVHGIIMVAQLTFHTVYPHLGNVVVCEHQFRHFFPGRDCLKRNFAILFEFALQLTADNVSEDTKTNYN